MWSGSRCQGLSRALAMQWFMFAVFLCGLLLLMYALRGMKRERVCTPSWASHPPGSHLNIAIVTFSNEALQIKQKEKRQEVQG